MALGELLVGRSEWSPDPIRWALTYDQAGDAL
jgi:hypothetical protein